MKKKVFRILTVFLLLLAVMAIPAAAAPGDVVVPAFYTGTPRQTGWVYEGGAAVNTVYKVRTQEVIPADPTLWFAGADDIGAIGMTAVTLGVKLPASQKLRWSLAGSPANAIFGTWNSYTVNLDDYDFEAGKTYSLRFDRFVTFVSRAIARENMEGDVQLETLLFDAAGNEVERKDWMFNGETSLVSMSYNANTKIFDWNSDDVEGFYFDFTLDETTNYTGYKVMVYVTILYRALNVPGNHANDDAMTWWAFEGAHIIEAKAPPSEDDLWQDEQRGFWERLWQMLQGMWDAIVSIPAKIGEWFQQLFAKIEEIWSAITGFFEMLWRWIMFLFNLIVKALNMMTALSGALPWWLLGAFIALVAVCVIYKILGREASG